MPKHRVRILVKKSRGRTSLFLRDMESGREEYAGDHPNDDRLIQIGIDRLRYNLEKNGSEVSVAQG